MIPIKDNYKKKNNVLSNNLIMHDTNEESLNKHTWILF